MEILESVGSTMDAARDNVRAGLVKFDAAGRAHPVGVATREQTAGRGQRGRHWFAPRNSNLCATFYFRPAGWRLTPSTVGHLAFLAGVAVADVLQHHCTTVLSSSKINVSVPPRIGLKWPNDVLLNGKKMGGILIELIDWTPSTTTEWVALIGVGLNVNVREFPPELADQATSLLREGLPETDWQRLGEQIGEALPRCAAIYRDGGFPALLAHWKRYDETPGRLYETISHSSPTSIVGEAEEVEMDGSLRLRLPDGSVVSVQSATSVR